MCSIRRPSLGLAVLLVEGEALAVVGLERCEADAVDVVEDRLDALLGQGCLRELVVIAYVRPSLASAW